MTLKIFIFDIELGAQALRSAWSKCLWAMFVSELMWPIAVYTNAEESLDVPHPNRCTSSSCEVSMVSTPASAAQHGLRNFKSARGRHLI